MLPVNSVKDLIALAKAKPGVLNYSSAAIGSSYHLAGELFKSMAGLDIVSVPYVGAGPTIQAVISNEVQMSFGPAVSVSQFIKLGRLKALAHAGTKPTPLAPDLPSMAASGLPGYAYESVNALFAPARTPANIVRRLNQEFARALSQEDVKQKILSLGSEAQAMTPEEIEGVVKSKYATIEKLIKTARITTK